MLMMLAAVAAQAALGSPEIIHASADDCAVIVAIGRSQVQWGEHGPNEPFFVDGALPDGADFREDCPWRSLGVGDPVPARQGALGFAIDRPIYGADGKSATAALSFTAFSKKNVTPFASVETCSLVKQGGGWTLVKCVQNLIT
jgi:hypothetical protein